ncbi:MAG TPA: DMT family transporter [Candidatus Nanopelagicales bacterium]|nr:DMT family transporter [Candidatus Nanopelagicales bacterium]
MHRRQVLDYLLLAVIWGLSFVLVLKVVQAFGWAGGVSFRALVAAGLLLLLARLTRRELRFGSWRPLAVVGATTVAGNLVGLNIATPRIGTAMAAIFIATIPLFSMLIGLVWRIESVDRFGRIGVGLGFVGVVLLVGFPAVPVTGSFVVGCVASVLGAFSAAFGSNYARKHLQQVGSWEQTIGAFLAGGLIVAPLLAVVPLPQPPGLSDVGWLVALAAFCSALAYVLYFRLVAEVGATIAVSVEFLVTVIAVVVGAAFLGERLSWVQVVGGVVIIGGCSMVLGLLPLRRDRDVRAMTGEEPAL